MNRLQLLLLALFFVFALPGKGVSQSATDLRTVENLRTGWKFIKGEQTDGADKSIDDSDWESVTIPHDWAISGPFDPNGKIVPSPSL